MPNRLDLYPTHPHVASLYQHLVRLPAGVFLHIHLSFVTTNSVIGSIHFGFEDEISVAPREAPFFHPIRRFESAAYSYFEGRSSGSNRNRGIRGGDQ